MNKRDFIKQGITFSMGSFLFTKPYANHMERSNLIDPSEVHLELYKLINSIRNDGNDVEIEEEGIDLFERFMTSDKFRERFDKVILDEFEELKAAKGISLSEDQKLTFLLFSASIRWAKIDRVGSNIPLFGGFSFNHPLAMTLMPSDRWKRNHEDFLEYEETSKEDAELLRNLVWFDSPTAPNVNPSTSYYTCLVSDGISFPSEFYFYDDGVIYPLPFTTYTEYLRALMANVGVECWQYFYVEPELVFRKNKGLNYMTTDLRSGTRLVEDLHPYTYNDSYDFDRLDLIYEYLQRVHRFLPDAFPTFDFDHQKVYIDRLKDLL
jgi:hypothetical protein